MRLRIRTVKPEMRQDERYARLSLPARELFNGLITMADDEGRFRALTSAILGHVFPYDEDAVDQVRKWVGEIKQSGMVLFYVADNTPYGAFRHWARHQKINRPTPSDLPPPPSPKVVRENGLANTGKGWRQLSESSANGHGDLTESSLSPHSSPRRRAFRSDPIQVRSLCERLGEHIRRNDPKADPKPESGRWLQEMDLLVQDRGSDIAEIERIIDWCQRDGFWRSNILSPTKLRAQFTQLVLRAGSAGLTVIDGGEKPEAIARADRWQRGYQDAS